MNGRREPGTAHGNNLVPPHRRARVAFALIFFSLSLSFLNYVGPL
ncbi:hypothetical protein QPM17_13565 [Marinobacter sp. TBZ242]|uniref:MFS transporter n=1 Tax=Marinobacter azerbaijanicus TaxID=3050455 RepID=A0ABT7IDF3_9GAMM|nr:hypothetical protein [Marinobacter sp. TBZ242]MDL0432170.1 hypothetical protein [Marinobacter sp. TBZ242]